MCFTNGETLFCLLCVLAAYMWRSAPDGVSKKNQTAHREMVVKEEEKKVGANSSFIILTVLFFLFLFGQGPRLQKVPPNWRREKKKRQSGRYKKCRLN